MSDWSSDVCSSDLNRGGDVGDVQAACLCQESQGLVDRHAHSFSRGLNVARLHGRVRASSWARMIFSHAVRQADVEPGRQNTSVPLASPANARDCSDEVPRSEEHTSELQSLMRISYAVFCLKKKT